MGHFKFSFTREDFAILLKRNPEHDEWYNILIEVLPAYGITTPQRVAGFISQTAFESYDYRRIEENLNYSLETLMKLFGDKYFRDRDPKEYAHNPEKIANLVYGDRLGNGPEGSGDGWKYRGRGVIQLTGKYNYEKFAAARGMSIDQVIPYLETKRGALEAAAWFWRWRDLDRFADNGDVEGMTRRINGGLHGIEYRRARYDQAIKLFSQKTQKSG